MLIQLRKEEPENFHKICTLSELNKGKCRRREDKFPRFLPLAVCQYSFGKKNPKISTKSAPSQQLIKKLE